MIVMSADRTTYIPGTLGYREFQLPLHSANVPHDRPHLTIVMKYSNVKKHLEQGFSLIEMLVVIAVIGVIAAIAIPNIGNINGAAKNGRNQRNAQSVASVYTAGTSAGVAWTTTSASAAVDDVIAGKSTTTGAFANTIFRCPLPGISSADLSAVKAKLTLSTDNQMIYTP